MDYVTEKDPAEATGKDKELLDRFEEIRERIHEQTHELYQLADKMAAEGVIVALQPGDCPACLYTAAILMEAYSLRMLEGLQDPAGPKIDSTDPIPPWLGAMGSELH